MNEYRIIPIMFSPENDAIMLAVVSKVGHSDLCITYAKYKVPRGRVSARITMLACTYGLTVSE